MGCNLPSRYHYFNTSYKKKKELFFLKCASKLIYADLSSNYEMCLSRHLLFLLILHVILMKSSSFIAFLMFRIVGIIYNLQSKGAANEMKFETDLQCTKLSVFRPWAQIVTALCFATHQWRMQHHCGKKTSPVWEREVPVFLRVSGQENG